MKRVYPMNARAQAGVGLIEVLIALLVLSIGMLGMAGLQMWSLKSNQGSMERGMAVMQTHTIADAMRAARTTATKDGFDIGIAENIGDQRTAYVTKALAMWRQNLVNSLGQGATGGIDCNQTICTIRIRWVDRQPQLAAAADGEEEGEGADAGDEATQELVTVVRL